MLLCVANVGANYQLLASFDGINWTPQGYGMATSWTGIAWSPDQGQFLAFSKRVSATGMMITHNLN